MMIVPMPGGGTKYQIHNMLLRKVDDAGYDGLHGPDDERMSFGTPTAIRRANEVNFTNVGTVVQL